MSIIGIGSDIVEIERIANAIRKNNRFASKILGNDEYILWQKRKYNISFAAKRFAAKEAFAKALGIGFRTPISWHNLQILPNTNGLGQPQFIFSGSLLEYINTYNYICHISLADERLYAIAYVVIEKYNI